MKATAIRKVATFADFNADNDRHGEHDFGASDLSGRKFLWKIVTYDADMQYGSEGPADPSKTVRIPTIILATEY